MANIIEFCGAPGVGKSTVYNAINKRWKATFDWAPAHKVYPRKSVRHPLKRMARTFLNEQSLVDEKAMRKAASRFIAHYPDYIDECWCHLVKKEKVSLNKSDQRFEKASHIFKTIQRVQISSESLAAKMVLVEEGLVNGIGNALHKGIDECSIEDEIQDLYNLMPLPAGLVFFEVEGRIILKRLHERKRFVPSFDDMNQELLLKTVEDISTLRKTAVKIYEKKGYPVLHLNGADSAEHNANRTIEFLNNIAGSLPQ